MFRDYISFPSSKGQAAQTEQIAVASWQNIDPTFQRQAVQELIELPDTARWDW